MEPTPHKPAVSGLAFILIMALGVVGGVLAFLMIG